MDKDEQAELWSMQREPQYHGSCQPVSQSIATYWAIHTASEVQSLMYILKQLNIEHKMNGWQG